MNERWIFLEEFNSHEMIVVKVKRKMPKSLSFTKHFEIIDALNIFTFNMTFSVNHNEIMFRSQGFFCCFYIWMLHYVLAFH